MAVLSISLTGGSAETERINDMTCITFCASVGVFQVGYTGVRRCASVEQHEWTG